MKKRNKIIFSNKKENVKKEKAPINTVQNVKAPKKIQKEKVSSKFKTKMSHSVRAKILVPIFGIAVLGIVSCFISIVSLGRVQQSSKKISDTYLENIMEVDSLSQEFTMLQKMMLQHCLAEEDGQNTIEKSMEASKKSVNKYSKALEDSLTEDKAVKLYQDFQKKLVSYLDNYEMSISMSKSGNNEGAIRMTNGELTTMSDEMCDILAQLRDQSKESVDSGVSAQKASYYSSVAIAIVMLAIIAVILGVAVIICNRTIVTPLVHAHTQLNRVVEGIQQEKGDLTVRLTEKSEDEIGQLAKGINIFIETLQDVMTNIINNTQKMNTVVDNVAESSGHVNENLCDISASMEELSATMEEVNSNVGSMSDATGEIQGDVAEMADTSDNLNGYSVEMAERATALETNAVTNKVDTDGMIKGITEKLTQAIENSKNVSQVNDLTDQILRISGKTNLLALNASIEAARAGEAGRGFAVVADEIRQLAESTKSTVGQIQEINQMVIEAVNELANNANNMVEYTNTRILPDYESFVTASRQYQTDAKYINDKMNGFSEKSDNLKTEMEKMGTSMENISRIIAESSTGVSNAARSAADLVDEMGSVNKEMIVNQEITADLRGETDKFIAIE